MAPSRASYAISPAIAVLDYLHAPAVVFYFFGASLYATITLQKSNSRAVTWRKKSGILVLIAVIFLSYVAEAIFYAQQAISQRARTAPESSVIHALSSALVWLCLALNLTSNDKPLWHPHVGAWFIGAFVEIAICAVTAVVLPGHAAFARVPLILSIIRSASFVALLFTGLVTIVVVKKEQGSDEESEPLLANGNGTANGTANGMANGIANGDAPKPASYGATDSASSDSGGDSEDEDENDVKKKQQERLEQEGGWLGYLKAFSVFLPYLWPKDWKGKACLVIIVYGIIQERFLNVLVPRQMGIITTALTDGGPMPWRETVVWFLLSWISSFAGFGAIESIAELHLENYSYQQLTDLSFNHVMGLSMDFHSNKDSGEVLRSVEQANALTGLLQTTIHISPLLIDLVVALWYVTHLFDVYMAFIIVILGVSYVWLGITMTKWSQSTRRGYVEKSRTESKTVYESISNWQTVTYFNRDVHERERYKGTVSNTVSALWHYIMRSFAGHAAQSLLMKVGYFSCIMLAVWKISSGQKPVGNLVTLIMYWASVVSPLGTLASSYRQMATMLVDSERVLQLLRTKATVQETEKPIELEVDGGKVEFEDVNFAYDERKPVLKSINFTAEPGKTIAFVGETGGGKSTILKLLFRFYDITSGSVRIDGHEIRSLSLSSLRNALGVVPQDPSMFNQTILENIRYARLEATDEEIHEACKAAAVHDKIMSFPDGYASKVGERGVKLSGGELQRVAIARVLVKNPKIVMLDEATSAVDSSTEQQIQEAFRKLSAGRTTFVVAHRLSTIMEADLILVIDQGEIVERGSHDELLRKSGKYLELWTKQTASKTSKPASKAGSTKGDDDSQKPGDDAGGSVSAAGAVVINDLPADTYSQELAKSFGAGGAMAGRGESSKTDGKDEAATETTPLINIEPSTDDEVDGSKK